MMSTLVPIGRRWSLWPQLVLRGAGFPAAGVLRLAPEGLAAAADAIAGEAPDSTRRAAFEDAYRQAAVDTAFVLREIAADDRFRAAITWQNQSVVDGTLTPFLAWTPTVASRTNMPRKREELVARYWQRFCVKNDTIGFFGPVGWGRFDPALTGIRIATAPELIESSEVYLSSWAIDSLAKTLDRKPGIRRWLAPRRVPFVRLDDGQVHVPGRPPVPIGPEQEKIFALCDGVLTADEIGRRTGVEDTARLLERMCDDRWLTWRLEVPAGPRPERALRTLLDRIGEDRLRRECLETVELLESRLGEVRTAANADSLGTALSALGDDFTGLTDVASLREKGARVAPCRAVAYADARRGDRVLLGTRVAEELAPLELFLTSARWMATELARRTSERAKAILSGLGPGPVDLASFWFACMPLLHGDAPADAADIQAEFRRRWSTLLPAEGSRTTLSADSLRPRVEELFPVPPGTSGWAASRYVSPDVLLLADNEEAIARGDFQIVLGELHTAINTMGASVFLTQHPDVAELLDLTTGDFPGPRLLPLLAKENHTRLSARTRQSLVREQDYQVALLDHTAAPARPRVVLSADALVSERAGQVVVRLPDGREFDVLEVFSQALTRLVMDAFQPVPDLPHTPRITVDRLVVARETWRPRAGGLSFAQSKTESERFLRAREWARHNRLPRFVFAVSPTEPRPLYVDFDSPVYVQILAKAIRRLARKDPDATLVLTEMLPTPKQTWLTDGHSDTYTAELRLVAVDQLA
ncbi:lantibiotic dehydratase domain-containing protein [Amycolatopsis keratiniphila]|uniref:Lantibiotic dehydratase domain-containing protein n=2 Tax=Amycolatopsis keratiniphila TaxID=129921 RepID=R4T834_9PSEU|nr:lantibiotic dehydratase domain-containing protein [Amycolatopsis keratiniphila]